MAEENNVTFVGGKALEQTEAPDVSDDRAEELSEAKAAVKKAIAEAAKESSDSAKSSPEKERAKAADKAEKAVAKVSERVSEGAERDPDTGKFLPKDGKAKPAKEDADDGEDLDVSKDSLSKLIRNREKLAQKHKAVNSELTQERERLAQEQRQLQQHYAELQQMQQRIRSENERFERIRKDPSSVARELGYDPDQFILDLAREGTPEGQASRQMREMQRQLEENRRWREEYHQAQQEQQRQYQEAQIRGHRNQVERQFLGMAMQEDQFPAISSMYKGRERALLAEADLLAAEFRQLTGGREATLEEVLEFLEEDLAERSTTWYSSKSGKKVPAEQVTAGKPGKGSRGKALTPEVASERRSLGKKPLKDLDDEERRAAARAAVGLAVADSDD